MQDISNIVSISQIVFYANTIIISWLGYLVWKKQISGRRDHDLAYSLLPAIYQYRDALNFLRLPNNFPKIPTFSEKDSEDLKDKQKYNQLLHNRINFEKKMRYSKLSDEKTNLEKLLFETKVVFGDFIQNQYYMMKAIERELIENLERYEGLFDIFSASDDNVLEPDYTILFVSENENDTINLRLDSIIKNVEKFLEPKLFVRKKWYQIFFF